MSVVFDEEAKHRLEEYLFAPGRHLPVGLGSEEKACSVAAINLALTGKLTDIIPDCMSRIIGKWIIRVQDSLPDEMRNSREWKLLLIRAAGTGRDLEQERRQLVNTWLWETVLPAVRPYAVRIGLEDQWDTMMEKRDYASVEMTRKAARQMWAAAAVADADAAVAADAVADAVDAAAADAVDAAAADAAVAAVAVAAAVAAAAAAAVDADADVARQKARKETWESFKPYELLESMIVLSEV